MLRVVGAAGVLGVVFTLRTRFRQKQSSGAEDGDVAATPGSHSAAPPAVLRFAVAWAHAHGLTMTAPKGSTPASAAVHVPFSLFPTPFPKAAWDLGQALAQPFNRLFDAVGRDTQWLSATLRGASAADAFTSKLLDVMDAACPGGKFPQPLMLGVHRSDYMLHEGAGGTPSILQVEFNTIASSFGCLSTRVSEMHAAIAARFPGWPGVPTPDQIPDNTAAVAIPEAMAAAHAAYGVPAACVVFIVQPGERNVMDQRMLEFRLLSAHGVRVLRRSLEEVQTTGRLDDSGALWLPDTLGEDVQVAVVYFRAGYTPDDYPTHLQWDARLLLERSRAIKCPSVSYHLAGSKKVQQVLAQPGVVERFVSAADADVIRRCFAGLWSLDGSQPDEAAVVADARAQPGKYVMKPQREGGGNNMYGDAIVRALDTFAPATLAAHILMERIFPPTPVATMVHLGDAVTTETVNEFGVFSVFLGDGTPGGVPLVNKVAGHLLRTKANGVDEGGVATGFSVLDSPRLV